MQKISSQRNPATGLNALELGDVGEDAHPEIVEIPVHGAANLDSVQLLTGISQLVAAVAHEQEARQPVAGQGRATP